MNTQKIMFAFALVPAVMFATGGCSKTDKDDAVAVGQDIKNAASDSWDGIKSFTYEQRSDFSSAIDRMDKSMDDGIAAAKAKASSASNATADATAKDRAAAAADYDSAKADLKTAMTNLGNATADTWADAKAKVATAWQRVKADYDKATS